MANAYAMSSCADAKAALEKLHRELLELNPAAARSLEEGREETLTVHRLGLDDLLRCTLATTNPIESAFSVVDRVCGRGEALAGRRSARALGGRWSVAGREKLPAGQRLPALAEITRPARQTVAAASGPGPSGVNYKFWRAARFNGILDILPTGARKANARWPSRVARVRFLDMGCPQLPHALQSRRYHQRRILTRTTAKTTTWNHPPARTCSRKTRPTFTSSVPPGSLLAFGKAQNSLGQFDIGSCCFDALVVAECKDVQSSDLKSRLIPPVLPHGLGYGYLRPRCSDMFCRLCLPARSCIASLSRRPCCLST